MERDGKGSHATLRQRAGNRLRRVVSDHTEIAATDVKVLLQELEVHQVELELQNEDLRQTQEALIKARDRYRELYELAPVGYLTLDSQGTVLEGNMAAAHMCSRRRERLAGRRFEQFMHPDDRDPCHQLLRNARAERSQQAGEARLVGATGESRCVRIEAAPRMHPDGSAGGFRVTLTDITERRRAEDALRESEQRFRVLVEGAAQAVWETDASGRVLADSPSWRAYTGQLLEDWLARGWLGAIHPEDHDNAWHQWHEAVTRGRPVNAEFRLMKAGNGWRWTNVRAEPLRGPGGSVLKWVGMNIDITERKMAEIALREADRRKGEFLATLGHELRNPLAALVTGLEAQAALPPGPELERIRGMMERQARQLSRLVDDLLDIARISRGTIELRREPLDLSEAVREAVAESLPGQMGVNVRVTLDLPEEPLPVDADPVRLSQVLNNLLGNAAKFSQEGSEIRVRVQREGHCSVVSVRDDGVGIDPETLSRIFDLFAQGPHAPFLPQGGLGIGLAMVRKLLELHGGSVEARSKGMGHGSEFIVRLPLSDAVPAAVRADAPRSGSDLFGARVLVVDDDPDVANGVRVLLELNGAEVRVVYDGMAALDACNAWRPTAVLMDLGMPGMDGFEAARRLCERDPDRPFRLIAMSGWGQEEDRLEALSAGFDIHMTKPFGIGELSAVLTGEPLE